MLRLAEELYELREAEPVPAERTLPLLDEVVVPRLDTLPLRDEEVVVPVVTAPLPLYVADPRRTVFVVRCVVVCVAVFDSPRDDCP